MEIVGLEPTTSCAPLAELTNAPKSLMVLFVEHISTLSDDITSCIKKWSN